MIRLRAARMVVHPLADRRMTDGYGKDYTAQATNHRIKVFHDLLPISMLQFLSRISARTTIK